MDYMQTVLLAVFLILSVVGYLVISKVPSLLHTPLMSAMNAFSGVTILGCLSITAVAVTTGSHCAGCLAIALATINLVAGFGVTHRMLRMFDKKPSRESSNV